METENNTNNRLWDVRKGDYQASTRIPNTVVGKRRPLTLFRILAGIIGAVIIAVSSYFILLVLEFI